VTVNDPDDVLFDEVLFDEVLFDEVLFEPLDPVLNVATPERLTARIVAWNEPSLGNCDPLPVGLPLPLPSAKADCVDTAHAASARAAKVSFVLGPVRREDMFIRI